ncbi:hypothetical protein B0O99DRAFT_577950 [Bisporella sp. PMI_857]|nr:hypothetical protein B0O99DRAFT_577950 [Bisporella sp. PMI_857]
MLTRGAQVTGVAVCSLCLTWISVSLRFYVRIGIQEFIGREDWLTLGAMILFTTLCSLLLQATNYGLGAHMHSIPSDMLETGLKYVFICELLYVMTTTVAKLSIGVYFLRLSSKKYQVQIIYATLGVVMLFSAMYFFFLLFQCTPIQFYWTQFDDGRGSCLSRSVLANVTYAHAAMSAATDWSFGILPIFFVWKMTMNPRTKLSVVLILSLGFFASTATIVRIVYIHQLEHTTDYSWHGINLVKWSMVEPAIGITAAAIATLRPLFANFLTFATKRFANDSETSLASSTRTSTDNKSRISAQEYSPEFAEMLGLKRLGTTTYISAAKPPGWRERRRIARGKNAIIGDSESQTELKFVNNGEVNWSNGIRRTTVVFIEKE